MRIGVLTLPLHTNYGGILQAYALQTILKGMGHDVFVIDTKKEVHLPLWKWPLSIPKRFINKYIFQKDLNILAEKEYNKIISITNQNTQQFIKKYIERKQVRRLSEIKSSDFDAIVVGSDQVWRPLYFKSMFKTTANDSFLEFAKNWNIKRFAYAASFGTEEWEYTVQETERCKFLAPLFDAISVREKSGVLLCKSKLNVEALHVLDPTMLLTKENYIGLIEKANIPPSEGNLFCYILDETDEKNNIIKSVSKQQSLKSFKVNVDVYNEKVDVSKRIQPPIEQWLRGFYDADFVITDSFHACVFSIIFRKPFLAIGNIDRGMSRFQSLLELFSLENRLISEKDNPFDVLNSTINWNEVETCYKIHQIKSFDFLEKHLK